MRCGRTEMPYFFKIVFALWLISHRGNEIMRKVFEIYICMLNYYVKITGYFPFVLSKNLVGNAGFSSWCVGVFCRPWGKYLFNYLFRISNYSANILIMSWQAIRPGAFEATWGKQRQEYPVQLRITVTRGRANPISKSTRGILLLERGQQGDEIGRKQNIMRPYRGIIWKE